MNVTITIKYNIWNEDDGHMPDEDWEEIKNQAEEHIQEMMKEGYKHGEISLEISDRVYRGGWNSGKQTRL